MAWEDFLNHTCDIYHIVRSDTSPGYGLPGSPAFSYPDVPDLSNVPCHFTQGGSGGTTNTVQQKEPEAEYDDRIKLALPAGTDVRFNDKIIDHRNGYTYYAEVPRTVHGNHHIYVYVARDKPEVYM